LLLRHRSPEAKRDAKFARAWEPWLPHAGFFHFGSKDVRFRSTEREVRSMLRRFLAESPQPAFFKTYRKLPRVQLTKPLSPAAAPRARPRTSRQYARSAAMKSADSTGDPAELFRVLLARRTQREFSRQPLASADLAELLFYTWGVTGSTTVPLLGSLPLKTSPSGGARHPGEVYVLALHVRGLRPGLYHYLPRHHALERIRAGQVEGCAVRYCAGQKFTSQAAALFIMTAVIERSRWKYRMARAYRVLLTEAGHLCQVFYLVATALGLAPFCTMALGDSAIEKDLGLDGINEIVLYVAGVGLPQ
jgi:SagB-type dehydrogenase family enzyme